MKKTGKTVQAVVRLLRIIRNWFSREKWFVNVSIGLSFCGVLPAAVAYIKDPSNSIYFWVAFIAFLVFIILAVLPLLLNKDSKE